MNNKAPESLDTMRKINQNLASPFSDSHRSLFLSFWANGGAFKLGGTMRTVIMTLLLVGVLTSAQAYEASWYSRAALVRDGQDKITHFIMANGKEFKDEGLTVAAGKQFKLGTILRITNIENGKSVIVEVADRIGKRFYETRLDLSPAAMRIIGGEQGLKRGLLPIKVEIMPIYVEDKSNVKKSI